MGTRKAALKGPQKHGEDDILRGIPGLCDCGNRSTDLGQGGMKQRVPGHHVGTPCGMGTPRGPGQSEALGKVRVEPIWGTMARGPAQVVSTYPPTKQPKQDNNCHHSLIIVKETEAHWPQICPYLFSEWLSL